MSNPKFMLLFHNAWNIINLLKITGIYFTSQNIKIENRQAWDNIGHNMDGVAIAMVILKMYKKSCIDFHNVLGIQYSKI